MTGQSFPDGVLSVFPGPTHRWPLRPQGKNECSFYALAHALNTLHGAERYAADTFRAAVGPLFQRNLGGTLPPLKAWQLRALGYGSHYGCLAHTDAEWVLRGLVRMGIPVIVDIYTAAQIGLRRIYGQHAVVLVGYSEPYRDATGTLREEYYLIDSEWPHLGRCDATDNNVDRDGDGLVEDYPGNRTLSRAAFLQYYTTRTYTPIFPDPTSHVRWYNAWFSPHTPSLRERLITGSQDRLLPLSARRHVHISAEVSLK